MYSNPNFNSIPPLPPYLHYLKVLNLHIPNWNAAMHEEFDALTKHHTWDLVPKIEWVNIICCLWLFHHKYRNTSELVLYKARLVANGKSQ